MAAEDAADVADDQFLAGKLATELGGNGLGLVGSLRVHHRNVLDGTSPPEVPDHALDGARPRPYAIDRLDLAVANQEQRLEVEHRPDHRLRPAQTTAHLEVAKRVEQRENTTLGYALLDRGGSPLEGFAFGRHLAQKGDRHRDGLAVDDVDPEAFNRLGTHTRALDGR